MKLCRLGLPDVDLSTATKIESREAVAMYTVGDRKIYKLLNYNELIHRQKDALKDLVYSPIIRLSRGTYHYKENGLSRTRDVLVIEMKQLISTRFFQMSNGGSARLIGWINSETDSERLKRISRALIAAKMAKLTDPQGFFMTAGSDPVIFIDLHCGDVENTELDAAITAVGARRVDNP